MRYKLLAIIFVIISTFFISKNKVFAQAGPGGVSSETVGNSNLKIWLDSGEISASDNTTISSWPDISLSAIDNTPTQATGSSQPIFRSNVSAGINGKPVVRFAGNKYFSFASSNDINQNGLYTERSTFLVFKTGSDITTRQILFEQGGNVRGLNIFIVNDTLYLGGYDFQVDGDGTPTWGFSAARKELQTNTTYVVSQLFNGSLGATTGTITGYLDGQVFAINAANIGSLFTHPDAPGLGAQTASTVMENGVSSGTGSNPFLGDASKGYRKATNITNPIEQGKGYHVYTLGGKTLDLTGPVYQGNISIPVTYTDDPSQAISQDGWNLVGNPYPCPVDWLSANWVKTNLSDEFHIWDPQNQNYQSFVSGVGTNGGTRYIPAGMSFFVKANGGGVPVLTIQEGTKVDLAIPFIKNSSATRLFRIKSFFNDKSDEIAIIQNPSAS